jgi:uncharacterized repeat protein (TIGR01451 family)
MNQRKLIALGLPLLAVALVALALLASGASAALAQQSLAPQAPNTPIAGEGFEDTTFPPTGWSQVVVTTSATAPAWTRETAGTYPTIAPHNGVGMAKFNSFSAQSGGAARLETGSVDLSSYPAVIAQFWMSHDTGYSTNNDRVQIQVSVGGGAWQNVGAPVLRYDASCGTPCWRVHSVDISALAGGQADVKVGFLGISAYGNNFYLDNVLLRTPEPAFNSARKLAPGQAEMGDVITYTLLVTNTGDLAASDAHVTDVLPAGTSYVNAVTCTSGACNYADGKITWTGALAINAGVKIIFAVDTDAAACGNLVNSATITDTAMTGVKVIQANTLLIGGVPLLNEGLETTTFPPTGWTTTNVTGTTNLWSRQVGAGTTPAISPRTGAAMAKFAYGTAGNGTRLQSPTLDLSTATAPVLKFWMSHDTNYMNYYDGIRVQVSVSGGAWQNVGPAIDRRDFACATACWRQHVVDLSAFVGNSDVRVALLGVTSNGANIYVDDISVAEPWYPCPNVAISGASDYACQGGPKVYHLTVQNAQPTTDTLNLSRSGNTWPTFVTPTVLSLGPGESGVVTLTVGVPWAAVGASDAATVQATAQTSGLTDNKTITTMVGQGYTDHQAVPSARLVREHSLVYYNGKLYKIGGYDTAARAYVDIYDIATNRWTVGAPLPSVRYWIDCVEIGGKIYCAGGYSTAAQTTMYEYDPALNTWTTKAALTTGRYAYGGVALGGYYYIIGGYAGGYSNALIRYDPVANTYTTLASMTAARRYPFAAAINGRIYVTGGYNGSTTLATTEVYNPGTNTWSMGANLPATLPSGTPIAGWSRGGEAVEDDRYMIIAGGGYLDAQASVYMLAYDTVSTAWTWLPNMNHVIYGSEIDSDGTNIWMASGRISESGVFGYAPYTTKLTPCVKCRTTFTYSDLENVVLPGEDVYLAGSFNAWNPSAYSMTHDAAYTVFTGTQIIDRVGFFEPIQYKYVVKSGGDQWDWLNTNNRNKLVSAALQLFPDFRNVFVAYAHSFPVAPLVLPLGAGFPDVGEVFVPSVTNGPGPGRSVMAQAGYGNIPALAGWTWTPVGYVGENGNNDVRGGIITPTLSGTYSYTLRFDGNWAPGNPNKGWTYADTDGVYPGEPFELANLNIVTLLPPDIDVIPPFLTAELTSGQTLMQPLLISNTGAGLLTWSIAEAPAVTWLSQTPVSGTTPSSGSSPVNVDFDTTGLPQGVYTTTLVIASTDPEENPWTVPVTLTVHAADIEAAPLSFAETLAPNTSASQTLTISNTGDLPLDWALVETIDWLSTNPVTGSVAVAGAVDVDVTFDSTGLTAGVYTGTLTLDSNDPDEASITIPVTLVVEAAEVVVDPLSFYVIVNPNGSTTRDLYIGNTGNVTLTWAITETPVVAWLSETPDSGLTAAGVTDTISLNFNATGLTTSTLTTTLYITTDDPYNPIVTVDVTMDVRNACVAPAVASFDWTPLYPVPLTTVTFNGTSDGSEDPYNKVYSWDYGNGEIDDGNPVTTTFPAAGDYTVVMTATNDCGSATTSQVVTVGEAPVADFSIDDNTAAVAQVVNFTDASTGTLPLSYAWDFGDTYTSTATNPAHAYATLGTKVITLTVTNLYGSDWVTGTVVVGTPPTADFISNSPVYAPETTIVFTYTGSGATSWLWNFGDAGTSTDENPSHTYILPSPPSDTYTVTLEATNDFGTTTGTGQVTLYNLYPQYVGHKYGPPAAVNQGVPFTYTIIITNSGWITGYETSIVDTFPTGTTGPATHVSASSGAVTANTATNLTWEGIVGVGESVELTFVLTPTAGCGENFGPNVAIVSDPEAPSDLAMNAPGGTIFFKMLLRQGFELAGFPPAGWVRYNDGSAYEWGRNTTANYVHSGVGSAYHAYNGSANESDFLRTPAITIPSGYTAISFWEFTNYPSYYAPGGHTLWVCNSTSDCSTPPTNYTQIIEFVSPVSAWRQQRVDLSAYAGQTIYLAFRYSGLDADDWYIDDIEVSQPCPTVEIGPNQAQATCSGGTVAYVLEVYNGTDTTDTIDITMNPASPVWNTAVTATSLNLAPFTSGQFTVTVDVPWTAMPGDFETLVFTATGLTSGYSGVAHLTTQMPGWDDSWLTKASSLQAARYIGLVYDSDYLYQIGGQPTSNTTPPTNQVHRYDIAADTWLTMAPLNTAVYGIDPVAIGGKIYVAGGYNGSADTTGLQIYDIASNTWSAGAAMPGPATFYQAEAINGKLYVFGGRSGALALNTVAIYDPATNTWSMGAPMATARYNGAAGYMGGKVYLAGGYNGTTALRSVEVYDPSANTWHAGPAMPMAWMEGADGVLYDQYLLITGGYNAPVNASTYGLYFDAASGAWGWLPTLGVLRYGAGGAGDGTNYFMIGGRQYTTAWSMSAANETLAECVACEPPSGAAFTFDPAAANIGATIAFTGTATGTGPLTYDWDFADGNFGSGITTTHTYNTAGSYDVLLTVTGQCGAQATITHTVTITPWIGTFIYHDLEDVVHVGEEVYIAGSFNGWSSTASPMIHDAGYTVFTATLDLNASATYHYKYVVKSGGDQWDWLNTADRDATFTSDGTVHDYRFVTAGYQHLVGPATITVAISQTTVLIHGEVYIQNVTNPTGVGRGVHAQVGYGTGTNLDAWTWVDMAYVGDNGNNDVFEATFTPGATGVYSYAVRFDGNWAPVNPNIEWVYGDLDGVWPGEPFEFDQVGIMTVKTWDVFLPYVVRFFP